MITVTKIKKILPVSKNIDDNIIQPQIALAENKYIKPVMGTLLFDYIQDKYNQNGLDSIETQLVSIAQISLAYYVIENTLPFLSFVISEKGVQQQNGINSQSADPQGGADNLNYMRNELRNNGEFYQNEIRAFLNENKASFPLYDTPNNNPTQTSNFDIGCAFYPTNSNLDRRGYFY